MRHLLSILFFLPLLAVGQLLPNQMDDGVSKRILIAHPTVTNINVLQVLQAKGLLDLKSVEVVGVYHKDEKYNYAKSKAIVDTLQSIKMRLVELKDDLSQEVLFKKNDCSDEFEELFTKSCAAFFFGGPDIPPAIYKEEPHQRTVVTDTYRHYFEASFLFHLLGGFQNSKFQPLLDRKKNYLINGFCLGMQTMNVATGGTLIQDIPSEVYGGEETEGLFQLEAEQIHRNFYVHLEEKHDDLSGSCVHQISFIGDYVSTFFDWSKEQFPHVNSYHHQAIERLGKNLIVWATSLDHRIVEAIYHQHYPNVFAVQFHPERIDLYSTDRKYKFDPNGESQTLSDWIGKKGMRFHQAYWTRIKNILNDL
ncbi:hypothetical protein EYV94_22125 [Puteibacter caeruleilacunae]|nr:hypothetical protein EYV94_22125 [Puteibacter caeruleilacunae]